MAGTWRSAWRQRHVFIISIDGDMLTDVMSSEMCGVMGEDDNKQCLTSFSQPSRAKFVCPQYKSTKKKQPYCHLKAVGQGGGQGISPRCLPV
jgi:hypothetical protein